jgi:hypothetical protein
VNPHNLLVAIDPPGQRLRRWRCLYCGAEGLFEQLFTANECTHEYPACESCGQTPTCAPDCIGVAAALAEARPPAGDA